MDVNSLARYYGVLEHLVFGPTLQRCRVALISRLAFASHCILLGEGNGQFLTRLVRRCPLTSIHVLDASATMLDIARKRVAVQERVVFHQTRLPTQWAKMERADVVACHFFLDCLTNAEVERLVREVRGRLRPGGGWLISEFALPRSWIRRGFAIIWLAAMYQFCRITTGLAARWLPDYSSVLVRFGFRLKERKEFAGGFYVSEWWEWPGD